MTLLFRKDIQAFKGKSWIEKNRLGRKAELIDKRIWWRSRLGGVLITLSSLLLMRTFHLNFLTTMLVFVIGMIVVTTMINAIFVNHLVQAALARNAEQEKGM